MRDKRTGDIDRVQPIAILQRLRATGLLYQLYENTMASLRVDKGHFRTSGTRFGNAINEREPRCMECIQSPGKILHLKADVVEPFASPLNKRSEEHTSELQ